jgi:hypothetical protein
MKMANNFVHYVKREIILNPPSDANSPFYAELKAYESSFDSPRFHVTRSKSWPVSDIQENDIIWLVAQLSSPWGKLPPSIDGKIIVDGVREEELEEGGSKIRFDAKEGSMWFPLVDATATLSKLEVMLKNGNVKKPFDIERDNLGQAYQSMKKISNPDILDELASKVTIMNFEFISYRIADGTQSAFFRALEQVKRGRSIFWDRWSLPRRLSERRELVPDVTLDRLLMTKIKESELVWGIESPRYDEDGSYSQKEKELATKLRKYRGSESI